MALDTTDDETATEDQPKKKSKRGLLIAVAAAVLVVGGGLGGAYAFVPAVSGAVHGMLAHKDAPPPPLPSGPIFADLPEMSVTLPNGGQARQLRIRISLELRPVSPLPPTAEVLSPKVYDALLTYLRTLTDSEIENSLAIDRIRGDVYRRLTLVLGPDVVKDVLITSLVVA